MYSEVMRKLRQQAGPDATDAQVDQMMRNLMEEWHGERYAIHVHPSQARSYSRPVIERLEQFLKEHV